MDPNPNRCQEATDSFVAFGARAGPMTQEEKDYLIRKGQALEDSKGDLYGEPSTLSFHMSHLVHPPILTESSTANRSATKTNAAAMAKGLTPSRAGAILTSVQELDESINTEMEGLYLLADESETEDNVQLSNINVVPMSPPAPNTFPDSFGPSTDGQGTNTSLEPMDLSSKNRIPTPRAMWTLNSFTPSGGRNPADSSSLFVNVTSLQEFNTTTGTESGEIAEAIRNLFPATPVATLQTGVQNECPSEVSSFEQSDASERVFDSTATTVECDSEEEEFLESLGLTSASVLEKNLLRDTSSLLVNVTSLQDMNSTVGSERGDTFTLEGIRDLYPPTPAVTPAGPTGQRKSLRTCLSANVTYSQDLNSTARSDRGETLEAIRDLYPPTPTLVATAKTVLRSTLPRKCSSRISNVTPIPDLNNTTIGDTLEAIRDLYPPTPVSTAHADAALQKKLGSSLIANVSTLPDLDNTMGSECGDSIRNLFPPTPVAKIGGDIPKGTFTSQKEPDSTTLTASVPGLTLSSTVERESRGNATVNNSVLGESFISSTPLKLHNTYAEDSVLDGIGKLSMNSSEVEFICATQEPGGEGDENSDMEDEIVPATQMYQDESYAEDGMNMDGQGIVPVSSENQNGSQESYHTADESAFEEVSISLSPPPNVSFTVGHSGGGMEDSEIDMDESATVYPDEGQQETNSFNNCTVSPSPRRKRDTMYISCASGSDLDDTLSNMEKLLAMAEEAERMGRENENLDFEPFPKDLPCSFNEDLLAEEGHGEELQQFEESFPDEVKKSPVSNLEEMILSPARDKKLSLKRMNTNDFMDSSGSSLSPCPSGSKSKMTTPTLPTSNRPRGKTPSPLSLPPTEPLFKTPALPGGKTPAAKYHRQLDELLRKSPGFGRGSPGVTHMMTTPKGGACTSTPLRQPIPLNLSSPASTIGYPTPPVSKSKTGGPGPSNIPRMAQRQSYKPAMSPFLPQKSPLAEAEIHKFASPVADYIYNTPTLLKLQSGCSKARIVHSMPQRKIGPVRGTDGDGKPKVSAIPVRAGSFASTMKYPPQEARGNRTVGVTKLKSPARTKTPVMVPLKSPIRSKTPIEVKVKSPIRSKTPVMSKSPARNKTPAETKAKSPIIKDLTAANAKDKPKPAHYFSGSPALISFDSPAAPILEVDSPALMNFESPPPISSDEILSESAGNTKKVVSLPMNLPIDSQEFQQIMKQCQEKEKQFGEKELKQVNYFGSEKLRDGKERTVEAPIISATHGANPIIILGTQNKENVLAQRHTGEMSESFSTSIVRSEHIIKSFIPSRVATTSTIVKK